MSSPDYSRHGTEYRTIKKKSAKLAGWLVSTTECLRVEGGPASSGGSRAHDSYNRLSVSRLNTLTDLIVNAVPRIEVPLHIVDTAEKIYQARQERAILLRGSDPESDDGHQHIITVIKGIHRKLESHCQASQKVQKARNEAKAAIQIEKCESPIHFFQSLKIEGSESGAEDDSNNNGPSVVLQKQKRKKKSSRKRGEASQAQDQSYHLEEDEDPYFVLMCLLSDLNSIRDYIKEIWQDYKDGKVDLVTVSLTTTATFDIIRTYEDDFPAISSLLSDYSLTMKILLSRRLDTSTQGYKLFFNPCTDLAKVRLADLETVGGMLSTVSRLADLTFATSFYFLNGPRHLIVKKKGEEMETTDMTLNPFIKEQEVSCNGHKLPATVRRLQEDVRALATFAQFAQDFHHRCGPLNDHTTQIWIDGLSKADSKVVSLAQIFAAQLYLDINVTLGVDVERGFKDLLTSDADIIKSMEYLECCSLQSNELVKLLSEVTSRTTLAASLDLIHQDEIWRYGKILQGSEDDDLMRVLSFLKCHPLLCGMISSHTIQMHRSHAMHLAQRYGTIKSAGQFYYSCQRHRMQYRSGQDIVERHIVPSFEDRWIWDDMDFVMQAYGQDAFFEGRLPETNEDFIASLSSTMESALIKRGWKIDPHRLQGHRGPIHSRPGHKDDETEKVSYARDLSSYECIAVTHRLFFSRYNGEQGEWTIETLQALLEDHLARYKGRGNLKKRKLKGKGSKLFARTTIRDQDGDISQVAILETLKETLQRESRALRFDYMTFHLHCFELLCHLRDENRYLVESIPDRHYYNNADISKACATLQVKINLPDPTSDILCSYGKPLPRQSFVSEKQAKVTLITKKGHVAVDSSIRHFLENKECKDREIKKLASIWGIATS